MEINPKISNLLRDLATAEGRSEEEVLEEALVSYLQRFSTLGDEPNIGSDVYEIYVDSPEVDPPRVRRYLVSRSAASPEDRPRDGFLALIDRMSSRFDLDEDEAMRIAVEEQHAFRRESANHERTER